MAHFAELDDNNVVLRVVVVGNDCVPSDEHIDGETWCINFFKGGTWKQTSYNTYGGVHKLGGTPFRKNYAGIGDTYDASRDAFIEPHEFPSWVFNETTCMWNPPTSMPDDGKIYKWDEDTTSWVETTPPT